MKKRLISLFLVAMMALTALAAMPVVADEDPYAWMNGTTLTYWYPMWQGEADFVGTGTMGDLAYYQALEEKTGVTIEFIHPAVADNTTAYYLMIASTTLPDIVTHEYYCYYQGGGDAAINEGVYIDLKDLMVEYAPEYYEMISSDADTLRQVTTDEGNIWCFYMIDTFAQPSYSGPIWRIDMLNDLGLSVPATVQETKDALIAMKDKLDMETPMYFPVSGVSGNGSIVGAYGVKNDFIIDGTTIKYGPIEDGYREYLIEMNEWYNEGLIQKDFAAYDTAELNADATSGRYGYFVDASFTCIKTWNEMMGAVGREYFIASGYPVLDGDEDGKIDFQLDTYRAQQNCTAVTADCKNPEVAVAWLGVKFTDEFITLANYGVEGLTFEYVDGVPTYTDYSINNPDGRSLGNLLYEFGLGKGPYNRIMDRNWFTYPEEAIEAMYIWEDSSTGNGELPEVFMSMPVDESAEYSAIIGDIKTYASECTVKFITGEMSVEADWDSFVATIKGMNIDRAIEIQQNSYDRYLAR